MDDVNTRVRKVLAAKLHIDEARVTPAARIAEDLQASSLDTVEAIMAIEDEFGLEIPDAAADEIKTVGDVIVFVEKKMLTGV